MNEEKKHQVLGSLRLGTIKKDSDSVRPIKVTLGSAYSVKEILSKAKTLFCMVATLCFLKCT